ncbi:hypothetical protein Pan14r_28840 [Crateriforma conspicua]|uniref:Uncharacterized protein n=1 Tax=Crateriforma conspicua TaxID=2527996 RepID=A0A5C5Y4N5_9PLAN|nr:hypothetical protein Mal65_43500 [Crateriforma conspicua]TWT70577.1 hypothetical protein Pan14r_28840 [Crateriforma conspicua]
MGFPRRRITGGCVCRVGKHFGRQFARRQLALLGVSRMPVVTAFRRVSGRMMPRPGRDMDLPAMNVTRAAQLRLADTLAVRRTHATDVQPPGKVAYQQQQHGQAGDSSLKRKHRLLQRKKRTRMHKQRRTATRDRSQPIFTAESSMPASLRRVNAFGFPSNARTWVLHHPRRRHQPRVEFCKNGLAKAVNARTHTKSNWRLRPRLPDPYDGAAEALRWEAAT